jgi:hypothetical protein
VRKGCLLSSNSRVQSPGLDVEITDLVDEQVPGIDSVEDEDDAPLSKAMEDFNIPSSERVALLERLQEAIGGAPQYFWAACQICDLETLGGLAEFARIYPEKARIIAGQTYTMILHCK